MDLIRWIYLKKTKKRRREVSCYSAIVEFHWTLLVTWLPGAWRERCAVIVTISSQLFPTRATRYQATALYLAADHYRQKDGRHLRSRQLDLRFSYIQVRSNQIISDGQKLTFKS